MTWIDHGQVATHCTVTVQTCILSNLIPLSPDIGSDTIEPWCDHLFSFSDRFHSRSPWRRASSKRYCPLHAAWGCWHEASYRSMVRLWLCCRRLAATLDCVPAHSPIPTADLLRLEAFIQSSRRLFVLTGAGVSTESGIKDYRSEGVGLYATTSSRPTNYSLFLKSASVRQRYWARNTTAWPVFSAFMPNGSHRFLASLENWGRLHWLLTQNVDNLHHKAGSRRMTELHGTVFSVSCLSCKHVVPRDELQKRIATENPGWIATPEGFAPDADVFVSEESVKTFRAPHCERCGGVMKPDVTFFGDTVPKTRVEFINGRLKEADACLVVGSSLETYSSYRHVRLSKDHGVPLLILNIGRTRADDLADIKITGRSGEAFSWLEARDRLRHL